MAVQLRTWSQWNTTADEQPDPADFIASALSQALGHARIAVLVTDLRGQLRFANGAGEALIGTKFRTIGGRLMATDDRATPALRGAIEAAAGPERRSQEVLIDTQASAGEALRIVVAPLDWAGGHGLAMLLAIGVPLAVDCGRLQKAFDLTPAEARLLRALIDGVRVADHAVRFGIKLTTAKTHLRQLFLKFGESRQADLVRRALNDPALRLELDPTRC